MERPSATDFSFLINVSYGFVHYLFSSDFSIVLPERHEMRWKRWLYLMVSFVREYDSVTLRKDLFFCHVLAGDANSSAATCQTSLPEDLQQAVEEDNMLFQQEMLQWDEEQRRKTSGSLAPPHSSPAHTGSSSPSCAAATCGAHTGAAGQKPASGSAPQASSGARLSDVKSQSRGRSLSGDADVVMTGEQRPGL